MTSRLVLALQIAREAGKITLEYFRREDLEVERKGDDSPVTAADRRAEEHLRSRIAEAFAHDAVVGEELTDRPGNSPFRWIVDPIDGTKSFIHGVPLYGTLIGIEHEGEPVAGVIHMPALDECVYASRGNGAWYVAGAEVEAAGQGFQASAALARPVPHQRSGHASTRSTAATSTTGCNRPPGSAARGAIATAT